MVSVFLPYLAVAPLNSAHAGTYIDVYGRLPITTGLVSVAEFTVDNGTPFISDYPPLEDIPYNATLATASNYRLYYNPHLSAGIHTLVIKPRAPYVLWLDYAIAGTGADLMNSGVTAINSPAPPSSTKSSSAKIVGGTTGPICLLLVILVVIYWVRKRQPQRNADSDVPATKQFPLRPSGSTLSCSR